MNKASVLVMFLGLQEPKPWEIEGRSGVTHRISVMLMSTKEPGTVKVSEELYKGLQSSGVEVTDQIKLVYVPRFRLKVENGRAVQVMEFQPDTFEYVSAAEQAAD